MKKYFSILVIFVGITLFNGCQESNNVTSVSDIDSKNPNIDPVVTPSEIDIKNLNIDSIQLSLLNNDNLPSVYAEILNTGDIYFPAGVSGSIGTVITLYLSDYIAAGGFHPNIYLDNNFYGTATYHSSTYNGLEVTYTFVDYIQPLNLGPHTIRFEAVTQIGTGQDIYDFEAIECPHSPSYTNITIANYRPSFSWTSVATASYYEVYRRYSYGIAPTPTNGTLVATVPSSQTSFVDNTVFTSGLASSHPSQAYYYSVYAVNSNNIRSFRSPCLLLWCDAPRYYMYKGTPPVQD